jgi:hypothetical protein
MLKMGPATSPSGHHMMEPNSRLEAATQGHGALQIIVRVFKVEGIIAELG